MERLGLWGAGAAFPTFQVSCAVSGGGSFHAAGLQLAGAIRGTGSARRCLPAHCFACPASFPTSQSFLDSMKKRGIVSPAP